VAQGYEVVDRNWRSRGGELDLVVRRGSTLAFCEVKTRASNRFGEPFEAVTPAKQARLRRLAAEWLRRRGPGLGPRPASLRFDVASIRGGMVEIIEDAF
jgi:putative endonuclease